MSTNVHDIRSISLHELNKFVVNNNFPKYRSSQIFNWINKSSVKSFDDMTNLPKSLIELLKVNFRLNFSKISYKKISVDSTMKFAIKLHDKLIVESVLIPSGDRVTACVSSQVGCSLDCEFCATSKLSRMRNLESYEIFDQIMLMNKQSIENYTHPISNIVFMGMGEPLLNYENVKKALKIVMSSNGLCISKRRITMSTSGIVPMIEQCGKDLDVNLAISLHAVDDKLRDELVPINKKYNISTLLQACKKYPSLSNSRRITWEYVMLKDVNDRKEDAINLLGLIKGIPSKINLIPFNPWPGTFYETSTLEQIKLFSNIIVKAGYPTPIRSTRGDDILAACGQLKSKTEKRKKSLLSSIH